MSSTPAVERDPSNSGSGSNRDTHSGAGPSLGTGGLGGAAGATSATGGYAHSAGSAPTFLDADSAHTHGLHSIFGGVNSGPVSGVGASEFHDSTNLIDSLPISPPLMRSSSLGSTVSTSTPSAAVSIGGSSSVTSAFGAAALPTDFAADLVGSMLVELLESGDCQHFVVCCEVLAYVSMIVALAQTVYLKDCFFITK